MFAGFVIFSTLGFMAENSGQLVKDVVDSGKFATYYIIEEG